MVHSLRTVVTISLWLLGSSGARASDPVALVIHGGAGVLTLEEMAEITLENGEKLTREHFEAALAESLDAGYRALAAGGAAAHVDAVEAAIRVMEDSELFNA